MKVCRIRSKQDFLQKISCKCRGYACASLSFLCGGINAEGDDIVHLLAGGGLADDTGSGDGILARVTDTMIFVSCCFHGSPDGKEK